MIATWYGFSFGFKNLSVASVSMNGLLRTPKTAKRPQNTVTPKTARRKRLFLSEFRGLILEKHRQA